MSKKFKISSDDAFWMRKLLRREIKECKSTIDAYQGSNRAYLQREVEYAREALKAYENVLKFFN